MIFDGQFNQTLTINYIYNIVKNNHKNYIIKKYTLHTLLCIFYIFKIIRELHVICSQSSVNLTIKSQTSQELWDGGSIILKLKVYNNNRCFLCGKRGVA